jgi:hypothetical protein
VRLQHVVSESPHKVTKTHELSNGCSAWREAGKCVDDLRRIAWYWGLDAEEEADEAVVTALFGNRQTHS